MSFTIAPTKSHFIMKIVIFWDNHGCATVSKQCILYPVCCDVLRCILTKRKRQQLVHLQSQIATSPDFKCIQSKANGFTLNKLIGLSIAIHHLAASLSIPNDTIQCVTALWSAANRWTASILELAIGKRMTLVPKSLIILL